MFDESYGNGFQRQMFQVSPCLSYNNSQLTFKQLHSQEDLLYIEYLYSIQEGCLFIEWTEVIQVMPDTCGFIDVGKRLWR